MFYKTDLVISCLILSLLLALLVHSRGSVDIPIALLKAPCITSECGVFFTEMGGPLALRPPWGGCDFPA